MTRPSAHPDDPHYVERGGWLRAAVLGGNDGIISIASLIIGVAAANTGHSTVIITGAAGLVAGAMSMAAGEYISVSAQKDSERADIEREKLALESMPQEELEELIAIYSDRGLSRETAELVASELMAVDPLAAHLHDELGLVGTQMANPVQAACASAATFGLAGSLPVLTAAFAPETVTIPSIAFVSILALALLGAFGATLGGAPIARASIRVVFWGVLAMTATAIIGSLLEVNL